MTFMRRAPIRFSLLLMVTAASISLAACTGRDEQLERDLAAPSRVDVLSPPMSPDPSEMHPALQIARSRGLKTNVYFNEELQQAVARLHGMEETLGRLQSDLQGTAMAMQRVEMMRQEVEALNIKIQGIQERLLYAGPALAPAPAAEAVVTETVTTPAPETVAGDTVMPEKTASGQISKPVVDEAPAKKADKAAAPAPKGDGVAGVRIGVHPDRVRIVLDVNGPTKFTSNVDNGEKLLTVELPSTTWSAPKTQAFKGLPVVDSYMAQSEGKGTVVAFTLKGDTKVLDAKTIKGEAGKPSRIVIDLSK
ncbi:MAG: hypothetical protein KGQ41_02815 [Alphaproteobacteria bacterium]|nr:hypothetical protein [Alphaproteobacteria bacterium]